MKIRIYIAIILSVFIVSFCNGQTADLAVTSTPDHMYELLDEATELMSMTKYAEAIPFAMEGYRIASGLEMKNEIARASLILSVSYRNRKNYYESLEFGLRSQKAAGSVSDEYVVSATLSLIQLFYEWKAWEKVIEYVKILESYSFTDAEIRFSIQHEKYTALRNLNKNTEAIWALEELIRIKDQQRQKFYMGELTHVKRSSGDISGALKNETKLMDLLLSIGSTEERAVCENNLGSLYLDLNEYEYAMEHLERSLQLRNDESHQTAEILLNFATALFKQDQTSRAMTALEIAEGIYSKSPSPKNHSLTLALKARIQSSLGDLSGAIITGNRALSVASEIDDPALHAELYAMLASLAQKCGDHLIATDLKKKSSAHKKEAEKRNSEIKLINQEKSISITNKEKLVLMTIAAEEESRIRLRGQLEQSQRDQELSALMYQKELQDAALINEQTAHEKAQRELELVRAALMSEQQIRTIAQLQTDKTAEQLKRNELEYSQVEREKGFQLLKQENQLLESERKLKEIEMEKQAVSRKTRGIAIFSLIIVLFVVLYNLYITRQKNKLIYLSNISVQRANEQLAGQNEEIISSIHYARNFQDTIVPAEETFQSYIESSFLIYQPLDIVSGDIPFLVRKENSLYIGAIDCIGHGVPAAMLSFMAYYNLSELISHDEDVSCGTLLSRLHERLGESLKKRYSNPNFASGIDIGLCKVNLETYRMQFAGANLPVLIVNKNNNERIKGEMQSVGDIYRNNDCPRFITHERQLELNDRIYLLSDGFIHQFGGEGGKKKFSMKRLTQELQDMHDLPMNIVKSKLIQTLNDWKGEEIQTDDIVLMGIELNQTTSYERKRA